MNSLPPPTATTSSATPATIDFSRPFLPEKLTPLFHTPAYATLTAAQRLRYNQLHALYFNEQTLFFEQALARNVLGHFLARPLPGPLRADLENFLAEEHRHSEMFRRLNRRCAPEFYARRDFHFIQVPRPAGALLGFMSRRPHRFPLLLWLAHLQEERSLTAGRLFLAGAATLEPQFVAVQRAHLADEVGHVHCDEILLARVWPHTGPLLRLLNVRLLAWLLGEYFSVPKRAAVRVVAALAAEFPALRPRTAELAGQLRALQHNSAFLRDLYSPANVPGTFRLFDAWPEFRALARVLPGYVPATTA